MIDDTGPSLQIFKSFNRVDAQFSKSTLNRAATCIQRWWRGFILRHRWNYLKQEVWQEKFVSSNKMRFRMWIRLPFAEWLGHNLHLVIDLLSSEFKKYDEQNIDNLCLILIKLEIFFSWKKVWSIKENDHFK